MSLLARIAIVSLALLFSTLLVFLSFGKALLAVAAIFVLLTIWRHPIIGLLFFALFATFIPYTVVQLGVRITISEAMLAITWLAVACKLITHEYTWKLGHTERWLIALVAFSLLPFFVGQVVIEAEGNGLVNWIRWVLNLSLLLLVPLIIHSESSRDKLITALNIGTGLMLLLSVVYFLKDRDANTFIPVLEKLKYFHMEAVKDIFSANYTRMASPWVHPNLTGGVLALFIPFTFFYGLHQVGWRKMLAMTVSILAAMGLLFSISRGAIVSLALVLFWLAWLRAPYAAKILKMGFVLAFLAVMFYPPLQERISTMFSSSNASTEVRVDEYKRFPDAVARYPLGIGFKTDPPPDKDLLGISNLWLNFTYKIGVLGMLMFIMTTRAWWKEVRPIAHLTTLDKEHCIWIGTLAGVLSALLTGLFDHYYSFTNVLVALFWMMVALNLQSARHLMRQHSTMLSNEKGHHETPHFSLN